MFLWSCPKIWFSEVIVLFGLLVLVRPLKIWKLNFRTLYFSFDNIDYFRTDVPGLVETSDGFEDLCLHPIKDVPNYLHAFSTSLANQGIFEEIDGLVHEYVEY